MKLDFNILKLLELFKNIKNAQGIKSKVSLLIFVLSTIIIYPFRVIFGPKCNDLRYRTLLWGVIVHNEDGIFYCRRKTCDITIISSLIERDLRDFFMLGKGIFIDVGAHIGKYTIMVGRKINGRVISIEPAPDNFRTLLKNIELNSLKNVIPLNVAVADEDSERDFFVLKTSNTGGSTLYSNYLERGRSFKKIKVKVRRLDNLLSSLGISKIDLLKIDVEGAEKQVLEGMGKYLKRTKIIIYEEWDVKKGVATELLQKLSFKIIDSKQPEYKVAINPYI